MSTDRLVAVVIGLMWLSYALAALFVVIAVTGIVRRHRLLRVQRAAGASPAFIRRLESEP